MNYLKSYVGNQLFNEQKLEKDAHEIEDPIKALDFGLARELDTILYYQEIKRYLPEHKLDKVEQIISEERKHYIQLNEMKKAFQE